MITIRASATNRISLCPTAALPPERPVNWSNEYSRLGTAAHDGIASAIDGRPLNIEALAELHGVEEADLGRAVGALATAWSKMRQHFPEPILEKSMQFVDEVRGVTLTGRSDLVSVLEDEVRVLDHKTGWLDVDATNQLKAYGFMGCKTFNRQRVYACAVQSRSQRLRGYRWELPELEDWWAGIADRLCEDAPPTPGTHCQGCPRWLECHAGKAMVRQSAEMLCDLAGRSITDDVATDLTGDDLLKLHEHRKLVEAACEIVTGLVRLEVGARGGVVESSDGSKALEIHELILKPIKFAQGEQVLRDALGGRFAECVEVGKTMVCNVVKEGAARGKKGLAIQELMGRLDAAGALGNVPSSRLELKMRK